MDSRWNSLKDQSIEFLHLQSIADQLIVLVYYERGGSCVFDSWDREILLNDALAASHVWCDQKKKKDASLDLVVSEPSTVAAEVATIALIPAIDPTVTSSASTIGVSQEPLIAITNYHISDLTMDEIEAQHDNYLKEQTLYKLKVKIYSENDPTSDLEEEPRLIGETSAPPIPKTAKQLVAKRNQERVKSILLLAIPDEYLLKFHNVADAKSLWEAIKSRFGGNEESKKSCKSVLYHVFCCPVTVHVPVTAHYCSSLFMSLFMSSIFFSCENVKNRCYCC
ncbi:hypothetical protein Tco_0747501 [Tanacetum coccineum]|uniref:Uncharacterized protein n=1 Tax=Tanacetum coccineum TaxID=301880 RepID=A0ABQ4YTV7_9ASTR